MEREKEVFNSAMSKPCVISEHTIGILKGRFPWLRSICNVLTEDTKSLKRIMEYIDVCVILHNLLVQQHDELPENWINNDDLSDIGDDDRAPPLDDNDELNVAVPANACSDERRRQLNGYINEIHVMYNEMYCT